MDKKNRDRRFLLLHWRFSTTPFLKHPDRENHREIDAMVAHVVDPRKVVSRASGSAVAEVFPEVLSLDEDVLYTDTPSHLVSSDGRCYASG